MRKAIVCAALLLPLCAWADAAETAAKLDALYAKRDTPAELKELKKATDEAVSQYPQDYGVLWRASRTYYWLADGATGDQKTNYGKQSWDLGERAVKLKPDAVEGNYYTAIGLGMYSQGVGILSALSQGLEGKFNDRLDVALKKDPAFDHAGPLIAKGRYYYELPWPKRDMRKSIATLIKATETDPKALRAWLYLAESQLKDDKVKAAQGSIQKVLEGSVDYNPPEGRRIKERAKPVKAEIDEKLK